MQKISVDLINEPFAQYAVGLRLFLRFDAKFTKQNTEHLAFADPLACEYVKHCLAEKSSPGRSECWWRMYGQLSEM